MTISCLLPIIFLFVGLIFIILSIPLIQERVSPNVFYGFRTEKTLSNPDLWYKVNKDFGYKMLYSGIILIVCNLILLSFSRSLGITAILVIDSLILLVPLIVSIFITAYNYNL